MSTAEKLRLQKKAIEQQLAEAEKSEVADSLRASFERLVNDDALPVHDIVGTALNELHPMRGSLAGFAERLAAVIRTYDSAA